MSLVRPESMPLGILLERCGKQGGCRKLTGCLKLEGREEEKFLNLSSKELANLCGRGSGCR